mmetsp:Transcript_18059/g.45217  ORF Transcript_18059/g.45217 Transcript_18059/m.45217 type:complete len:82 (+) Transcript_18059:3291-3536(+)
MREESRSNSAPSASQMPPIAEQILIWPKPKPNNSIHSLTGRGRAGEAVFDAPTRARDDAIFFAVFVKVVLRNHKEHEQSSF